MAMTKSLQTDLDKYIPKKGWFSRNDVILIRRTDYVLKRLEEEGFLKAKHKIVTLDPLNIESKYRFINAKH